jgi:predicted dehydrogenase
MQTPRAVSSPPPTRRAFLKHSAVAGAVLGFPAVLRAARPNSKVQVAAVGLANMGYNDVHNVAGHAGAKHVGLCDVDTTHFARADAVSPGVPHFRDFRVMLEELGDKVDAITVSTPDHMHALVAIEAMKRGKHVYCQKPLAHTVWEARQMRLWAAKKNVVTQMGNQIHSALEYRLGTRLLKEGAIGKIKEVHSWVAVTGNDQMRLLEPPAPGPVPAQLDWNLWIGCAAMRDYAPRVYHPRAWRDWQDFGGGAMGDFGCHILDPVFTALGLKAPSSVLADNSGINRHIWPTTETVRYVFPGTALTTDKTLKVTWTDGGLRPDRKLAQMPGDLDLPRSGSLFIGELGNMVLPHVGGPRLYPMEKYQGFAYPKDVQKFNHWHRWVDAIIEGNKTSDGFDYAGPLTETVQLGNVATRVVDRTKTARGASTLDAKDSTPLLWDAQNGRITNHAAANALLTKTYRAGWEVTPA